jgi:co-chaperonin GroES (HSP10)
MTKLVVLADQHTGNDEDIFPVVDPNGEPYGSRVLVQIRRPPQKMGSFYLTDNQTKTQQDNTCVAKVIAVGPLAYKNRNTMETWTEGQWCDVGSYVFVPKYGGIRWEVPCQETDMYPGKVQFALFDDLNILMKVKDPRKSDTLV